MPIQLRERLRRAIDSQRDSVVQLTERLIRCDTENPPGRGYRSCLTILRRELGGLGFEAEVALVPGEKADSENPRYWLRAALGDSGPSLYFHGHYDVVPAQDPARQFQPRTNERVIFGRGSADMKGGLVAMIHAMKALREVDYPLSGRIVLQVVPDEETGGKRGSDALSQAGLLVDSTAVGMLTAEPTSGRVWHASRGAITLEIRIKGRGVHVGLQHLGVNAFETMLPLMNDLMVLKREVEGRRTELVVEPAAASPSIMMMGGVASSGENFNVVPPVFRFSLDRRFNPEEDLDAEHSAIMNIVEEHRARGLDVEVQVLQLAHSANLATDSRLALSLADAILEVTGKRAKFEMCPGNLEIRFYAQARVPALAYGPGLLSVSHGPEEFVHRAEIASAAEVYALTAASLLAHSS